MIEAFQEQLVTIDELRARMPDLRAHETGLRHQIDVLDAQAADRDAYLKLADDLEGFLAQLRHRTTDAGIEERQRVLRLLVKDVIVGPEKITIRHRIPAPGSTNSEPHDSPSTEGEQPAGYPLRWGHGDAALRRAAERGVPPPVLQIPGREHVGHQPQEPAVVDLLRQDRAHDLMVK